MLREAIPDLLVLKDNPSENLAKWNSGEARLLAVHPASASHGVNAQDGGHTLVCMGPIWSLDMWEQLLGRLRRRGQKSPFVTRHTILASDTVDELVWDRLAGKEVAESAIMDHIRKTAGGAP